MAKQASRKKKQGRIVRYFRETVAELRKVNWPTRKEATQLTLIVLAVIGVTSVFLGLMDFIFARLIALVVGLG